MNIKEELPSIIDIVSPTECSIDNKLKRVWVFGGQISGNSESPRSSRDFFLRETLNLSPSAARPWLSHLYKPEDFPEWWFFSGYKDLLAFERDACYLAQAIILFAESPGALAELGAIASEDSLAPYTFVVSEEKYAKENSFLRHGPLKRIESFGGLCFVKGLKKEAGYSKIDFDFLLDFLDEWFCKIPKMQKFDVYSQKHQILLFADLVDLLLISKEEEIRRAAAYFSVKLSDKRVSEILGILDFFGLIKKSKIGKNVFYIRGENSDAPWVNYTGLNQSFDRMRFKIKRKERIDKNPHLRHIFGGG